MSEKTEKTETTPEKPARATPRAAPDSGETLQALAALQATADKLVASMLAMQATIAAQRKELADLAAIVQAALPAALLQLPEEAVADLVANAPTTRLRLLSPFKTPMMDLPAGTILLANDHRLRTHGRSMMLGLALSQSDAPAAAVRAIVTHQAEGIAARAREAAREQLLAEAEVAKTRAETLAAQAAQTGA